MPMDCWLAAAGLIVRNLSPDGGAWGQAAVSPFEGCCSLVFNVPAGQTVVVPAADLGASVTLTLLDGSWTRSLVVGGDRDIDFDGDSGTDADIAAFFAACTSGTPGSADFNGDGVEDQEDVAAFFAGF